MYQSTPQHVIDEESHPGFLHDIMHSSSSSSDSSDSNSSESDSTSGSVTTAKRIKRVLRVRKHHKSSSSTKGKPSRPPTLRTVSTNAVSSTENFVIGLPRPESVGCGALASGDEADTDGEHERRLGVTRRIKINCDFENEKHTEDITISEIKPKKARKRNRKAKTADAKDRRDEKSEQPPVANLPAYKSSAPRLSPSLQVQESEGPTEAAPRRSFNLALRGLTVRDVVVPTITPIEKVIAGSVFSSANPTGLPPGTSLSGAPSMGITPRALHRSTSLPGRLNQAQASRRASNPAVKPSPYILPKNDTASVNSKDLNEHKKKISRTSAILLLLISTALVAVCAEFLVGSINYLVKHSSVSEAFIGLIILPIVGNAAEHVCAVTVATKNKMDLAIGVAVGSSIQIALFVTPVIVLLAWILKKEMTLYFSLFETISLFVSAFIVNFLVLDGRSNYLEGALLIAAYVIIAVAAFFYPDSDQASTVGGGEPQATLMLKRAVVDAVHWATTSLF